MSGKPQRRGKGRGESRPGGGAGPSGGLSSPAGQTTSTAPSTVEAVTRTEDARLKTLKESGKDFKKVTLPARPEYGTKGTPVLLWANYFQLNVDTTVGLFRYEVAVTLSGGTRAPAGKLLGRLMHLLIEHFAAGQSDVVTDSRSLLISRRRIVEGDDPITVTIKYRAEGETNPDADTPSYDYLVKPAGTPSMSEILNYVMTPGTGDSPGTFYTKQEDVIQALNLIVGQQPKTQTMVLSAGKNRYVSATPDPADKLSLGAGLEALRAFVFSVRTATERMLVNVQIKNLAFYEGVPLPQLVRTFMGVNGDRLSVVASFVKRLSVSVTHLQRVNKATNRVIPRYKTVLGLASPGDGRNSPHPPQISRFGAGSQEVKFFLHNTQPDESMSAFAPKAEAKQPAAKGKWITVFDFFRERYGIIDASPKLPVVNVGTFDSPVYLPMHVCVVRSGQPASGKISSQQTKNMINFAVRKPDLNVRSITTSGLSLLGLQGNNAYLTGFGMSVTPQMIKVPGRWLPAPEINYGKTKRTRPGQGSWNLRTMSFVNGAKMKSWSALYVCMADDQRPMPRDEVNGRMRAFHASMSVVGMTPGAYNGCQIVRVQSSDPQNALEPMIASLAKPRPGSGQKTDMIVVIVPDRDSSFVYGRIKFLCDVRYGLLNICVLDTKLSKANDQYWANVSLKANLKLGGINHTITPGDLGSGVDAKSTMFVGLDVTHPSPGSAVNTPSIAGIVSSIDEHLAQWPAEIRVQSARQEMIEPLESMMCGCLKRWQILNKSLPINIIVYRDGVSEGQYQKVIDNELPALRSAAAKFYPATEVKKGNPKISIVIVGKRHHTRFYVADGQSDSSGNPRSGTVVDRGVTNAANWDFFLQAHAAIKGTARPAHYYVIYDEIFRNRAPQPALANPANSLEQLSYALCHLFGRATKAVSVCPPAYYADLVCERARCYLMHLFSPTNTPAGSVASPNAAGAGAAPATGDQMLNNAQNVELHQLVAEKMFYI